MSLFACGSIYLKVSIQSIFMTLEEDEIYMCLAALFADSWINGGAKKLLKYPFVEIVYFSVH